MVNDKRNALGRRCGAVGIVANILLAAAKMLAGIISGSVAVIADSLNNLTDAISSVITLVGFRAARRPADRDHPFGHARYEYIAGLVVAMLVVVVGFELGKSSVEKLIFPSAVTLTLLTAVILGVSALVKLLLYLYNLGASRKTGSKALYAAALDARNDAIVTTLVLVSAIVEHYTGFRADGYTGILVALFIIYSGLRLTSETVSPLIGRRPDGEVRKRIIALAEKSPVVLGYHDLLVHDYGPGISYCSIHLEIDKSLDPLAVHELIDEMERSLTEYGINLTVHYDPVITDSPELEKMREAVRGALLEIDPRLSLHDLRTVSCDGETTVFFDLPTPYELYEMQSEIEAKVNEALLNFDEDCKVKITFEAE